MSRGPYPILLVLAMSLPGAVRALGLGDIRIDSALNEPLSAQIDIVGATREELIALTAKVASREVFQRYGAERPGFLATASFKVGMDAQGRPVLNVRSGEAFTDPLVNLWIDLKWDHGELIREYSLLLDPAGLESRRAAAAAAAIVPNGAPAEEETAVPNRPATIAPPSPASAAVPSSNGTRGRRTSAGRAATQAHDTPLAASHVRVAARDTLRGIARRLGARTEPHVQRLMVALYRSNPQAFDGNINRLHRGTVLTVPDAATLAAVDLADARRTVRAQMTAWRLDGRNVAPERTVAESALQNRLQSLEQEVQAIQRQLAQLVPRRDAPVLPPPAAPTVQVERLRTPNPRDGAAQVPASAVSTPEPRDRRPLFAGLAAGAILLLAGLGFARRRSMRARHGAERPSIPDHVDAMRVAPASEAAAPASKAEPPTVRAPAAPIVGRDIAQAALEPTQDLGVDVEALEKSYLESLAIDTLGIGAAGREPIADVATSSPASAGDTATQPILALEPAPEETATMEVVMLNPAEVDSATVAQRTVVLEQVPADTATAARGAMPASVISADTAAVNTTVLDYDLLDLDATAQHVQMPSQLHEHAVVAERRTNIVDALKAAIERDPHRHDLRMKLLETYHHAVSLNRRAFVEHVKMLVRERDVLTEEQWKKVTSMGREIAKDEGLFDSADGNKLADCA